MLRGEGSLACSGSLSDDQLSWGLDPFDIYINIFIHTAELPLFQNEWDERGAPTYQTDREYEMSYASTDVR